MSRRRAGVFACEPRAAAAESLRALVTYCICLYDGRLQPHGSGEGGVKFLRAFLNGDAPVTPSPCITPTRTCTRQTLHTHYARLQDVGVCYTCCMRKCCRVVHSTNTNPPANRPMPKRQGWVCAGRRTAEQQARCAAHTAKTPNVLIWLKTIYCEKVVTLFVF